MELEVTENCDFKLSTLDTIENLQSNLLFKANQQAAERGFLFLENHYIYFFRDHFDKEEFVTLECDILDQTSTKIAIECYLYKRNSSTFIAKSFSIFKKDDL